jgi:hypothetical protein
MASERAYFVFSFHDAKVHHVIAEQGADQWYIHAASREQWELREKGGAHAFSDRISEGIESPDQLETAFLTDMGDDWPLEAITTALVKLRVLMTEGGWHFVGGAYSIGEGFDDVSLDAVLER